MRHFDSGLLNIYVELDGSGGLRVSVDNFVAKQADDGVVLGSQSALAPAFLLLYVLLNPLRVFVTVNVPSVCADNLIQ